MSIVRINSLGITDGTIVNGDINASAAIASTKLSGVNDAKAWVNFDGTGTPAIREDFNVTSITDNGAGDYTINFTDALTDANYAVAGMAAQVGLQPLSIAASTLAGGALTKTTTALRVYTYNNASTRGDAGEVNIAIFR